MRVYISPSNIVYNLDNFVAFEVKIDNVSQVDQSVWTLVGVTLTGHSMNLHYSESAEECNSELTEIRKALLCPLVISLSDNTIRRIRKR